MSAALLRGELEAEDRLATHLNHCLLCRACEKACPSEVPYGAILDAAQALLPPPNGATTLLLQLATRPKLTQLLARITTGWKRLHLPAPSLITAATRLLPRTHHSLLSHYPAVGNRVGTVGLFLGCITRPFDQQTHQASITLLTQLGYEVIIPQQQQCCGALAQHHGDNQQAEALSNQNRRVFDQHPLDAILFSSSGCGTQLVEHNHGNIPYREVCDFIAEAPNLHQLNLRPLQQQVSLHHPCSLRNVLQGTSAVEQLLQQIPSIRWSELGPTASCCGAAGSHQIREPETAAKLRQPKLDALQQSGAELLLTTNYGCALHFAEGLLQQQRNVEVLHPVTLLARQLSPH